MPEGYEKSVKVLEDIRTISQDLGKLLVENELKTHTNGPLSYYLANLQKYTEALFNNFSNVQVGDRVKLTRTLEIEEKSGWYGSRHMLIKDSLATVYAIDWSDGAQSFVADVVFDIESWISSDGTQRPVTCKHRFLLKQEDLSRVSVEEEQRLIKKESNTRQKIRLFFDIQKILLESQVIKKTYELSDYNKLGKFFPTKRELTAVLKQISPYLSVPKLLSDNQSWKTLSLEEFIDQIM